MTSWRWRWSSWRSQWSSPSGGHGGANGGDSKRAGDIKHGGTKGSTTTQGRQKDRAAPEARRPAIGIRAQATSRNVRKIVRIRAVCRSSHFISCWKRGSMCTCLIKNLSQRGQRRENREREKERERERERREHFRFRGSGELIKLPFRSGPRRELNSNFFWPGGYPSMCGSGSDSTRTT